MLVQDTINAQENLRSSLEVYGGTPYVVNFLFTYIGENGSAENDTLLVQKVDNINCRCENLASLLVDIRGYFNTPYSPGEGDPSIVCFARTAAESGFTFIGDASTLQQIVARCHKQAIAQVLLGETEINLHVHMTNYIFL